MNYAEKMEYIREYIRASDDGMFESREDLEDFVIDQLYDEFGEDLSDEVVEVMKNMEV